MLTGTPTFIFLNFFFFSQNSCVKYIYIYIFFLIIYNSYQFDILKIVYLNITIIFKAALDALSIFSLLFVIQFNEYPN